LLATHVEDEALSAGHGFPLRLVAPAHRGYDWVKWVVELEVSSEPGWLEPPLPLR
jgi:DMSO/TMAO reductase YedYZ molybdopterin-dependent catalytic subunit